eukprot:PhF_6_TR593/c1_g1_i5/m.677
MQFRKALKRSMRRTKKESEGQRNPRWQRRPSRTPRNCWELQRSATRNGIKKRKMKEGGEKEEEFETKWEREKRDTLTKLFTKVNFYFCLLVVYSFFFFGLFLTKKKRYK